MTTTSRFRAGAGSHRSPANLEPIVRQFAGNRGSWAPRVRFDPVRRWFTLLDTTCDYQVWLLSWLPGQSTGIHDHGGSVGAFAVVAGVLTERSAVPGRGTPCPPMTLAGGQVRSFGPAHIHDVSNAGPAPAISIHVYAPALEVMRRYVLDPRVGPVAVGSERAGVDW
jgi:predicted metal-dependent enzyme (double-stranded beta helix superfamily)